MKSQEEEKEREEELKETLSEDPGSSETGPLGRVVTPKLPRALARGVAIRLLTPFPFALAFGPRKRRFLGQGRLRC